MPSFSFYRQAVTPETPPVKGQWVLISVTRLRELTARNGPLEIQAAGPGWRLIALLGTRTI